MGWEVEYTDEFETWWVDLDQDDQDKLAAAVNLLISDGPNLKRPVVGKIEGATRHTHMKELIPGSSSIRVLSPSTRSPTRSCCSVGTSAATGLAGTPRTSRSPKTSTTSTSPNSTAKD